MSILLTLSLSFGIVSYANLFTKNEYTYIGRAEGITNIVEARIYGVILLVLTLFCIWLFYLQIKQHKEYPLLVIRDTDIFILSDYFRMFFALCIVAIILIFPTILAINILKGS